MRLSLRQLALLPFVWVVVLVIASAMLPTAAHPAFFRAAQEFVKVLALAGCLFAAQGFERGDFLRVGWLYSGACFLFILLRDLTYLPGLDGVEHVEFTRAALIGVANAFAIVSAWRFGRAWSVAELPDTTKARVRAYALTGILAFVLGAGSLVSHTHAALQGDRPALVFIASQLGDIASVCLLGPVLPTAFALRGGSLAWPWSMMAAAFVAWLFYDLANAIPRFVAVDDVVKRLTIEGFRALGCLFTLMSGIAQRRIFSSDRA